MLRTLLIGTMCLMGTTALSADMNDDTPWFVGINYVEQNFGNLDGQDIEGDSYAVFGGYQMNDRVSLELTYADINIDNFTLNGQSYNDRASDYLAMSAKYNFDDFSGITPFVRVSFVESDDSISSGGQTIDIVDRGFIGAIGGEYPLTESITLRAEVCSGRGSNNGWAVGPRVSF